MMQKRACGGVVRHCAVGVLTIGWTLIIGLPAVAEQGKDGSEIEHQFIADQDATIKQAMNVSDYELQAIEVNDLGFGFIGAEVEVDGETWTLELEMHSVRADDFQVLAQVEGGEYVEVTPPPVSTYRGVVTEVPDSSVSGGYWEGELRAVIRAPGRTIGIQPMIDVGIEGSDLHLVYDMADSNGAPAGFCGVTDDFEVESHEPQAGARGITMEVVDLGIDTDFEYWLAKSSNESLAIRDLELVVNSVEDIYEVPDIQITYEITTIILRTTSADPYTSNDAGVLLDQFTNEWNTAPESFIRKDVAHFFSGHNFNDPTLGIAWLATVCNVSNLAYSTTETITFSSNLVDRTALAAHELGHNWSAQHCDGINDCSIMCSIFGGCTGNITEFGNFEEGQILGFKNSRTCLSDVPDPLNLPFSDTFPTTTLDTDLWTYNDGATITSAASNEPTSPNSLNLDAASADDYQDDDIRTNFILLAGQEDVILDYFVQHSGVENGEELVIEYYTFNREWLELDRVTSDGIDQTDFEERLVTIPILGYHDEFRVRFRPEVDSSGDEWYIDNMSISVGGDIDLTPPEPNPMTFDVPPTPASTTSVTMTATTAVDEQNPDIEYEFDFTGLTPGGSDSGWQSSTVYVDDGLIANTLYPYRVRARDGASPPNETGWSDEVTTASAIETPLQPVVFGDTADSLTLLLPQTFSNILEGESGIFFDSTTSDGDGGLNEWIKATTDIATGLSPNTEYTFQAKARNQLAIETEFSPLASGITLANTPGAPILGNVECDSMTVSIDANGNPSYTLFAIQVTATSPVDAVWDGMYVDPSGDPSAAPVFQTADDWGDAAVLGLAELTTYTFAVSAQNLDGVETDQGPEASFDTSECGGEPCDGDVNGDGIVDPLDSGFVLARFGCTVGAGDPDCDASDANLDGVVDPLDVGYVAARFGICP